MLAMKVDTPTDGKAPAATEDARKDEDASLASPEVRTRSVILNLGLLHQDCRHDLARTILPAAAGCALELRATSASL